MFNSISITPSNTTVSVPAVYHVLMDMNVGLWQGDYIRLQLGQG